MTLWGLGPHFSNASFEPLSHLSCDICIPRRAQEKNFALNFLQVTLSMNATKIPTSLRRIHHVKLNSNNFRATSFMIVTEPQQKNPQQPTRLLLTAAENPGDSFSQGLRQRNSAGVA